MYPRISDFFNDIFGTNFCLPVQSFGFFVALAFLAAYLVLARECLRLQNMGRFPTRKVKVVKGGPIKELDIPGNLRFIWHHRLQVGADV